MNYLPITPLKASMSKTKLTIISGLSNGRTCYCSTCCNTKATKEDGRKDCAKRTARQTFALSLVSFPVAEPGLGNCVDSSDLFTNKTGPLC